ncbi:unnamed protein product, partial [Medioppia subpectinata]
MSVIMDITFMLNGIACGKWFRHQLDGNRHKTFTQITTLLLSIMVALIKSRYKTVQIKPFTHCVPYLAGLLYGYFVLDNQLNKHIRAHRLWPTIIAGSTAIMAVISGGLMPGAVHSQALMAVHMVYTGVYAVIIGLSAIIYTDSHNTSLCKRFLSSRWWRPIRSLS